MSVGSIIKSLRQKNDMTQEQLAEYLGITSRAVSQWECGRTAPDISQIPALCHIFDVSSDVLLGIDIERNSEEIKKYLTESAEFGYQGKYTERTALIREAAKKFPRDHKIMLNLADSIVCENSRKDIEQYDEVFELCRRILAECTESSIRYQAINTLGIAYGYAGREDEMLTLADEMPPVNLSYENFMMYRWKGDADFNKFQDYLSFLIYNTAEMIALAADQKHDNGEFIYSLEDRIFLRKTEVAFLELICPDGDYQIQAQLGEIACGFLCTAYLGRQDFEKAWVWLQKGADFAIHMDTYDFNAAHTSPILRGYSSGGWIMESNGSHCQSMLAWLTCDEETANLRSDARYEILAERLKIAAEKKKP